MDTKSEFGIAEREYVIGIEIGRLIVAGHHVSTEDRMFIGLLIIHPAQGDIFIAAGFASKEDFAAWIIRCGEASLLQNVQRDRRKLRRIDFVFSGAAKRRSQRDLSRS